MNSLKLWLKINKTPIAIILSASIIAIALVVVQINKANSIERQARLKAQSEHEKMVADMADKKLQEKKDNCERMTAQITKKWNNVLGVEYDDFWEDCVVTFIDTETDEVDEAPLSVMQSVVNY